MNPSAGDADQPHDLVGMAQNGDVGAFEALYRLHSARVFALCLRLTGDRDDATVLLQDAFVRAWERLATFRREAAFTTWLHRLTVNCFLEESRRSRRREARVSLELHDSRGSGATPHQGDAPRAYQDPARTTGEGAAGASDFVHAVDTRLDLEAALPRLAAGARRVFVLHDMYGYRNDEIATLLGIAVATVRVQLFRARKQLTEMLTR